MRPFSSASCWLVGGLLLLAGCAQQSESKTSKTAAGSAAKTADAKVTVHRIEPGANAQEKAQEALINCDDDDVIEFAEGTFNFNSTLSLVAGQDPISGKTKKRVTIRGAGMDKTILNFKEMGAGTGGEGIKITGSNTQLIEKWAARNAAGEDKVVPGASFEEGFKHDGEPDDFVLADLTVQDSTADAIKVEGAYGMVFRNVKGEWTRGPNPDNGAYALYPVLSDRVLIEGCVARGSSDAGVYVGQSYNVVVRNCKAYENVAGIEIENTVNADVYDNEATNNTGGLLVFSLPGHLLKNGKHCRVFNNKVYKNNLENFAKPGNIVANVPPGTGVLIMANDQVEVFNNSIADNMTYNVAIINYITTGNPIKDAEYDPYPEGISIHNNTFSGGGDNPQRELATIAAGALGGKLPDIIYDGWFDDKKLVDGKLPENLRILIHDNKDADFANLDSKAAAEGRQPNVSTDVSPYEGKSSPLAAVTGVAPASSSEGGE